MLLRIPLEAQSSTSGVYLLCLPIHASSEAALEKRGKITVKDEWNRSQTPSGFSFCPHGGPSSLLLCSRAPGQGWQCCSQQEQITAPGKGLVFQTINAHRTLHAAITIFLKMKFLCQKSLNFALLTPCPAVHCLFPGLLTGWGVLGSCSSFWAVHRL